MRARGHKKGKQQVANLSRKAKDLASREAAGSRVCVKLLFYNDEFHITIGVVKLLVVRVDPGSWVVDIQHCVRLASALRAVAQG